MYIFQYTHLDEDMKIIKISICHGHINFVKTKKCIELLVSTFQLDLTQNHLSACGRMSRTFVLR